MGNLLTLPAVFIQRGGKIPAGRAVQLSDLQPASSRCLVLTMPGTGQKTECKLVLLGDSNVGKSSLVSRFVKNQFNAEQVTTVGAAFLQAPVPVDDSDDQIQFGIWDTAGSERYKALAPMVRPQCSPRPFASRRLTAPFSHRAPAVASTTVAPRQQS